LHRLTRQGKKRPVATFPSESSETLKELPNYNEGLIWDKVRKNREVTITGGLNAKRGEKERQKNWFGNDNLTNRGEKKKNREQTGKKNSKPKIRNRGKDGFGTCGGTTNQIQKVTIGGKKNET